MMYGSKADRTQDRNYRELTMTGYNSGSVIKALQRGKNTND